MSSNELCSYIRVMNLTTGVISRAAGTGSLGFSGDGGPATNALLRGPQCIGLDRSTGDVLFCDTDNYRIRRISSSSNLISTVAGSGNGWSNAGDGGAAISCSTGYALQVATDVQGNIYFTSWIPGNERVTIRMVNVLTGIVTSVVGAYGQSALGDGGPSTAAGLYWPAGMAFDAAGDMIFGDRLNHRIRRVSASSSIITTIAGTGSAGPLSEGGLAISSAISDPWDICLDPGGSIYFSSLNGNISRISLSSGTISTFASMNGRLFRSCAFRQASFGPAEIFVVAASERDVVAFSADAPSKTESSSITASSTVSSSYSGSGTSTISRSSTTSSTASTTATGTASWTGSPSATQSATSSLSSTSTSTPTSTRSSTRSPPATKTQSPTPTPTQPICRAPVSKVIPLRSLNGTAGPHSTSTDGNLGMYTGGSCGSGLKTFYPGARIVYALQLGPGTPLGGTLKLSTCGLTRNNTVLYVGTGCPIWSAPFACIAGNDDASDVGAACEGSSSPYASLVTLRGVTSRSFFIQLGGYGGEDVVSGLTWAYILPSSKTSTMSRSSAATPTRSARRPSLLPSASVTVSRTRTRKPKV